MDYKHFVCIFNKTGSGDVFKFPIDIGHSHVTKAHPIREEWPELCRLRDFGVAVVDNKVYFIGGFNKDLNRCTDVCRSFNPKTQEWRTLAPMSTPRQKFAITTVGKCIIVAGGERSEDKFTTASEIYDSSLDEWSKAGLIPKCRINSIACTVGDCAYLSGGSLNDVPKDNIWIHERHTWEELDEDCPHRLRAPTHKHCMVAVQDKLVFIGGIRKERLSEFSKETELVTTGATEALKVYIRSGACPDVAILPREDTGVRDDADSESDTNETIWQKDDIICPWELQATFASMNYPRHSAGAVALGRRIYVFGGIKDGGGECRKCEYLDLDSNQWIEYGNLNRGNISLVTAVILVFANPENADYELKKEKMGKEGGNNGDEWKWILW